MKIVRITSIQRGSVVLLRATFTYYFNYSNFINYRIYKQSLNYVSRFVVQGGHLACETGKPGYVRIPNNLEKSWFFFNSQEKFGTVYSIFSLRKKRKKCSIMITDVTILPMVGYLLRGRSSALKSTKICIFCIFHQNLSRSSGENMTYWFEKPRSHGILSLRFSGHPVLFYSARTETGGENCHMVLARASFLDF